MFARSISAAPEEAARAEASKSAANGQRIIDEPQGGARRLTKKVSFMSLPAQPTAPQAQAPPQPWSARSAERKNGVPSRQISRFLRKWLPQFPLAEREDHRPWPAHGFASLLLLALAGMAHSAELPLKDQPHLRRPVAAAWIEADRLLAVANQRSGSISIVDVAKR